MLFTIKKIESQEMEEMKNSHRNTPAKGGKDDTGKRISSDEKL